ncbi:hypothetical protein EYF80_013705 [Liparis tanakae]|uniref:Uncharacterized protein n=1 Tax=Liparis tanakae TaxID=230148 RepID=A0A4Z2IFI1_9TELE|nr:hypothetical protein EYF80_013705 [Liparis tanakae]
MHKGSSITGMVVADGGGEGAGEADVQLELDVVPQADVMLRDKNLWKAGELSVKMTDGKPIEARGVPGQESLPLPPPPPPPSWPELQLLPAPPPPSDAALPPSSPAPHDSSCGHFDS